MKYTENKRSAGYTVVTAKDGNMTLVVNIDNREFPLHSRIAPAKENADPGPDPERFDLIIVLGCGLGYSLIPLKEMIGQYRQVVIVDILNGIENDIRLNSQTGFLASSGNVRFITGEDPGKTGSLLSDIINFNELKGIHVREHPSSLKLFPEYYREVKSVIKKELDKKASGAATIKAFGKIFLKNALFNLDNFHSMSPVSSLSGKFRGQRGLIVSSAPSVESIIERITAYREKFAIIAVDSALPVLECRGIAPDISVSIDPQQRIQEHFTGHKGKHTAHVFSIVSPPRTVKKYGGFISLNSHPVSQAIESIYPGRTGSIDSSTGSVAGDALALALLCGFEVIAMAGFDFSFSQNNIYARGTAYQQRYSVMFNCRMKPPESFNAEYIFRGSKGFMESGRYTRRSFIGYRDSLSQFISGRCPGQVMWFGNGFMPEGAVPAAFEEFINKQVLFDTIDPVQKQVLMSGSTKSMPDPAAVKKFLADTRIWEELVRESTGTNFTGTKGFDKFREIMA